MALPVSVPYAFANATTTQNLSYLDSNFNALANGLNGLANGASQISISSISATGNANATTYLRGDGSWATVSGGSGGTVTSVNANSTVSGFTFTGGPVTSSGTLTLTGPSPGTSGNVLTSDGTNWVSQINSGSGIGVGQTWTDLTSSRVSGTTYTNSTGKPIMVLVSGGSLTVSYTINGISGMTSSSTSFMQISFIVPNGNTYSVTNSNFVKWLELR